jgi:Putative zinc-finger
MSCRELERLWDAGATLPETREHQATCPECGRAGDVLAQTVAALHGLRAPAWSPALRQSLLDIPRLTVSCEGAEPLLAALLEGEGELPDADDARLRSHLSRCEACTETAATLAQLRELSAPPPPPWLSTRLAAVRPVKKRPAWRAFFSGRAVVVYAYAAAFLVMLLGLNPTALPTKTGFARLSQSTRSVVTVAQNSVGDRLGALQEKAVRTLAVWKGHVGGYSRAAVSNAIAIVWRPEPKRTPSRPRLGKEGTALSSESFDLAMGARWEHFPARFRV